MRAQQFLNLLNRLGHPTKTRWNVRIMERYRHGAGVVTSLARYLRGGPIKERPRGGVRWCADHLPLEGAGRGATIREHLPAAPDLSHRGLSPAVAPARANPSGPRGAGLGDVSSHAR
jgi:hypothetical protein